MTAIDELLARALLMDEPRARPDLVPHQAAGPVPRQHGTPASSGPDGRHRTSRTAASDLQTLCETVVTHTAADSLQDFITEQLPDPSGARVLGCVLQLTDAEDGARFWWQYAAGAGDEAASYCLYLHHLSLGETDAAAWWREQTRIGTDTDAAAETVALSGGAESIRLDSSTPTVLRVLGQLLNRTDRPRAEIVAAMVDYVPVAVALGYVDHPDFEIPLPGPDFAHHIARILDTASRAARARPTPQRPARRPLSRRQLRAGTAHRATNHAEHSCPGHLPEETARDGHR